MHWRAEHFNGVDWDQKDEKNAIYKLIDNPASASIPFAQPVRPSKSRENTSSIRSFFERPRTRVRSLLNTDRGAPAIRSGKGWATDVDKEHGNNDYLMCSNIDYKHPEVRKNISDWGGWMVQEIGVDGFRLDAAQHVSYGFTKAWIEKVQRASVASKGREVLIVGEVWTGELRRIADWLDAVQQPAGPQVYAYDSTLVYNFSRISEDFRTRSVNLDLRTVLDQTLLEARPEAAITLVTNHDTQFGQMSYTPMSRPLKLLFYAFILLRQEGLPCVFWGDLYGIAGPHAEAPIGLDGTADGPGFRHLLKDLMLCRRLFARGKQISYWHSMTCIGWIRKGTEDSVGCAVVLDIGKLSRPKPKRATTLSMAVGEPGETWIEIFTGHDHEVLVGEGGEGEFASSRLGVSIYVRKGTARPGFEAS